MWEKHAIADAKSPQEAINEQLLDRADLLLAVFNSRLGTPTKDYPGGTVEELERRTDRAALFFHKRPVPDLNAVDGLDQINRLDAFQKSFKGFAETYEDGDDLTTRCANNLMAGPRNSVRKVARIPLVARLGPWTFDNFSCSLEAQDRPVDLLLSTTLPVSFRSPEAFAKQWGSSRRVISAAACCAVAGR
jgi:hypothetical protein